MARNIDTRGHDIADSDDCYQYDAQGSHRHSPRADRRTPPAAYVGVSTLARSPQNVKTVGAFTARHLRSRVVDPALDGRRSDATATRAPFRDGRDH